MTRTGKSKAQSKPANRFQGQIHISGRWRIGILLVILTLAGALRFAKLDEVPPGLHVDEAANAWNAYTLLKTGKDQHGVPWPIFYARAFGENRSTSYIYPLLPLQAIGGMNVWTTRLPAAIGGVITVLLMYLLGTRLFDYWTGLIAAGLLSVNPWHVQLSRYGYEAALGPLLIVVTLAALLWAKMPLDDREPERARPLRAALAGALAGISCYGYFAVRFFLPIFLAGIVLVTWRDWWERLNTRKEALSIGALLIAFAITFGPLAWKHLTDPEMNKRARNAGWVWDSADPIGTKIWKAASRYPGHYGLDFLFINGDRELDLSPPAGIGLFHWYELPLMTLGLFTCLRRSKSSRAARLLLVWVALYPAADLLNTHLSLHVLRSLPGLPGLILLEGVGAGSIARAFKPRRRVALRVIYPLIGIAVVSTIFFIHRFFGDFQRQKNDLWIFASDILEAARWLRPRLNNVDAVFVTGRAYHPDVTTLVGLQYNPDQWFNDVRKIIPGPLPDGAYENEDVYLGYGKMHFMFDKSSMTELTAMWQNGRADHAIIIVRPGELEFDGVALEKAASPVYEIRNSEGRATLLIFDLQI